MKNNFQAEDEKINFKSDEIPLESSLGLLAFGDIAFTAWRKLKKSVKKGESNERQ